jgi:hypothetical protein
MKNRNDSRSLRVIAPPTASAPLARRMVRHVRWAGALTGKFRAQTDLSAWRPQEFVYNLHSWRQLFFLRNLQQFRFEQRHSHTAGPVMNNFFLLQRESASPSPAMAKPATAERAESRSDIRQEQILPPVLPCQEKWLPLQRTFSRSAGRPDGPVNAAAALFFHENLVRRRMLREVAGADEAGREIAAGIVRRAQRVEERPTGQSLAPVFAASAMRLSRDAVEPSELPARRQSSAGSSFETFPAMPPAAPFNVTQLTDEVMRQLDRRLVATRERMGKI